ncbi:hypothetical protein CLV30_11396 [Haloactinopolyspora alba]|uniref:Lipoprotein n=1 Tax=Haloactinopolyspora alba TaxID=648780 RepID=A0A2P8DWL0_9ACTN|nr:hypothetical protein [Haloactinopolyspora alba]PSL01608.1 hypothetical protein CLV30_11396 [Haloactinopolyspora alba]
MHVRPRRVRSASVVMVAASALAVSSCGGESVRFGGEDVANAEEVLASADDAFDGVVQAGVSAGTTTVSDDSRCYFREAGEDGVDRTAFCGPVRRIGGNADEAWLPVPLAADGSTEDGLRLTVAATETSELTAVDSGELFRPDGGEPVAADSLDEPQAPEAPFADRAVALPLNQSGVDAEFEQLEQPYTLITPSVTVTVQAAATLDAVPADVVDQVSESGESSSTVGGTGAAEESDDTATGEPSVPFYRPAEGQQVQAWQVTFGPPPEIAPAEDDQYFGFGGGSAEPRDASTSFALAAGNQRLTVRGNLDMGTGMEVDTLGVGCDEVPCQTNEQQQYLLLASMAEDASPSLVATVDGADQSLSLDDGTLTSDVSQVAYDRERLSQQVSTTWPNKTIVVRTEEQLDKEVEDAVFFDDITYNYGGAVQQVFLSPFDYAKGWAPSGKAWLTVPIINRPDDLSSGELSLDEAATMTLKVGDQRIAAQSGAGRDSWAVFQVNDTFTKGTVVYRPTGSVSVYDQNYPLKTDEPLTLDVALPAAE